MSLNVPSTHRPPFSCRFKGLVFDYALSFGDGMRMCQRHYAEKASYRHVVSTGDEMRHTITVEVADASYHLAAYSYDSTPHPTRIQELKLLRARAALRLACNVLPEKQDTGERCGRLPET